MTETEPAPRWSVGDLARLAGTTPRTLRHYDEIGLLRPSERTASGHRRYTERDLRRLYRIRALRALGMPLDEVRAALTDTPDDLASMRELLVTQQRRLAAHIDRAERLRQQIGGLVARIDEARMPDPAQFMLTLELISVFESYFTQEQRDRLVERRDRLGPEAIDAVRTEWAGVVDTLLGHVRAGTPPDDPDVRSLVERWDAIGDLMHDGDRETASAARTMWAENTATIAAALPWSAEDLTALTTYLAQARRSP